MVISDRGIFIKHTKYFIISGRLDNLNDYVSAERSNRYKGAKMKSINQNLAFREAFVQPGGIHIKRPVKMVYRWYERDRRRDLDNNHPLDGR